MNKAHELDFKIFGDDIQALEVELDPSEGVRAEVGMMMYMEDDIEMQTNTGGGIFKGLKRMITGESFFITNYLNHGR
ncbi:MAG TPA: AIM24 family protein, partial [Bacteroidia bacterium]|nr:AIM24 family protein [Bacteroidia bacterium]